MTLQSRSHTAGGLMAPRSLHRPPAGPSRTGRGCMAAPQGKDSGPGPSEPTGTSRTLRARQTPSRHCPHQPGRPPPPPDGPSPPSPSRCACLKGLFFCGFLTKNRLPNRKMCKGSLFFSFQLRFYTCFLPAAKKNTYMPVLWLVVSVST